MVFLGNEKSASQLGVVRLQKSSIFLEPFQLIYWFLKLRLQFLTLIVDSIPILLQVLYLSQCKPTFVEILLFSS